MLLSQVGIDYLVDALEKLDKEEWEMFKKAALAFKNQKLAEMESQANIKEQLDCILRDIFTITTCELFWILQIGTSCSVVSCDSNSKNYDVCGYFSYINENLKIDEKEHNGMQFIYDLIDRKCRIMYKIEYRGRCVTKLLPNIDFVPLTLLKR